MSSNVFDIKEVRTQKRIVEEKPDLTPRQYKALQETFIKIMALANSRGYDLRKAFMVLPEVKSKDLKDLLVTLTPDSVATDQIKTMESLTEIIKARVNSV